MGATIGIVVALLALGPGNAYRWGLQRVIQKEIPISEYRISDRPDVGLPGRIVVGLYLLLLAAAVALATRFVSTWLVPDVRELLYDDLGTGRDDLLHLAVVALAVIAGATALGATAGTVHGTRVARRVQHFQGRRGDGARLSLPWVDSSESWVRALLAFPEAGIEVYLRNRDMTVAGKLLAADVFTGGDAGRAVVLQPLDGAGAVKDERVYIRADEIAALICSDLRSPGAEGASPTARGQGAR